ncbi:MAG: SusC/RagA family TonB-linked outer membrane protein [Gemmatimonadaceae bacterium]
MRKCAVMVSMGSALLFATQAVAQQKIITGKVTTEQGAPVGSVSITVKGTLLGTQSNADGNYSVRAEVGQVLQYRLLGYSQTERTIGAENSINVAMKKVALNLDAMVVTALGEQTKARSIGTSQQMVVGADIAQTGRENFINGLQGRVAGVEVTSSSGVPGASSSITIRGVSSISSSNQPLMIIDGLPLDNKTLNTGVLASDAPGSSTAFSNRGVDFTNRGADINPEDIETMVVLKGAEAAALYGIDAANGAIVITTKRGKPGVGGFEYSNKFRVDNVRQAPEVQRVYGPSTLTGDNLNSFAYFGLPYADTTTFYDNVDGFFRTGATQNHNLAFSGASADQKVSYRLNLSLDQQNGVVRNNDLTKINLTASPSAQVTSWLRSDLTIQYNNSTNNQTYKGDAGPLIGLLLWPGTDNAKDFLTPGGTRRRKTILAANAEVDNPYFNIAKNKINAKNSRLITNLGFTLNPVSWAFLKTNVGYDGYTTENLLLRHPESALGFTANGILDQADVIARNFNVQTLLSINELAIGKNFGVRATFGNAVSDSKSTSNAFKGQDFLDPNFISINNTNPAQRSSRTTQSQRRLIGVFGSVEANWRELAYLTVQGRNDWTSTIPIGANSFFYPSVNSSIILDNIPGLKNIISSGKLRGGYAEVGRDANPYAYRPSLETKATTNGGYGYGFTGPNLALKPEFIESYEFGTDLAFFDNRVGLEFTQYRKQTKDQIVNDIRGSYATGFVLFNLNGAVTRNTGTEITLNLSPLVTRNFSWNVTANFDRSRGVVLKLPNALPETYVSDTWLFGNVRNGTLPGQSTRSLTGNFYLRNKAGTLLIDPTSGLPIRNTAAFVAGPDGGYDRQPNFTTGLTNSFRYKDLSLNFLIDFRRGGDVFNATQHYLTTRGLALRTLDRETPRVVDGILRDGKENTATPTKNTIVVIPKANTGYYVSMSEELFIEKDINWIRMRDITLRYKVPARLTRSHQASVFVTGTDLFLFTNYTGLDPIVNGNTAAVGGSGASGIDFGNFPMPRGVSFGLRMNY